MIDYLIASHESYDTDGQLFELESKLCADLDGDFVSASLSENIFRYVLENMVLS